MKNKEKWEEIVKLNTDPYGKACVDTAREVMRLLDEDSEPLHDGYYLDIHTPNGLICLADNNIDAGGLTGFMAGCVASMVVKHHDRGEEFKKIWNGEYKGKGVINPALVEIKEAGE